MVGARKIFKTLITIHVHFFKSSKRISLLGIKVIRKVGQTQHRKPLFGLFTRCNFKYNTKKLRTSPIRHKFQILNRIRHELSFLLCITWRNPHLGPLLPCSHLHCLCLLTSHVYLNAHTLIIMACINFEVS